MMNLGEDVPYYGSSEGTTSIETSEVIGTASVTGNGVFTCTYDLTMDATGENNMYEAVQSMSNNSGQLVLTVNGVRYDFSTSNLFPKTISGEMTGLTEGVSQDITAQLKLLNSGSAVQNELIGTDIEITFELDNFNCTVTEMGTSGTYVMKTSPANISEDLVEGLYRYQGTADEVTNNYICFGTSDKDACAANQAIYLYRILGITPAGELKVISNGPMVRTSWNDTNSNLISWPDSTIFGSAQSNANYYGTTWANIIEEKEWNYSRITAEDFNDFTLETTFDKIYNLENKYNNTISAKIGLLSLTDMYLHNQCYKVWPDIESCTTGWLHSTVSEWGMNTYRASGNSVDSAVFFDNEGRFSYLSMSTSEDLYYRPVGYLSSNLTLSGTGTIDDPYMISI